MQSRTVGFGSIHRTPPAVAAAGIVGLGIGCAAQLGQMAVSSDLDFREAGRTDCRLEPE